MLAAEAPERQVARRRARLEAVLVALVALAIFAVYAWSSNYWVDLTDEGYFLYLASRVLRGDLPYRDFDTYYTPGVFYLYASAMSLFGVSVMPVRMLMAAMRVACALLLYGLARRIMPPPFAILPFLMVASVDPMPVFPEPHPAWMATVATLVVLEAILRHAAAGRQRWLALAGVAAALAYLFKQNVGAFAALSIGGYLLLRPRERVGALLLAARLAYVIVVGVAVTLLLRPSLDGLVAAALWLPALAALAWLAWRTWPRRVSAPWTAGLGAATAEAARAGAAFALATLAWLVPLAVALGPREVPWGLFVGAVNQGALTLALEPPPRAARELALAAIWLPPALALLGRLSVQRPAASPELRSPALTVVGLAVALSLLVPLVPVVTTPWEPLTEDPAFDPWLTYLDLNFNTLYLYLPTLGAWGGLLVLLARATKRSGAVNDLAEPLTPIPLRLSPVSWYLLVGVLAALALYPRADTLHAMFAGPPLFVVGAWVLWRLHGRLIGGANALAQTAVYLALLVIPAMATAPHAYWRLSAILWADPRAPQPPPYVPLDLDRAPVLAPKNVADNVRGAVEFVRERTAPGEPLFAYPAVPLFNFLADRRNPTRFDHFFPHALTPEDLAEVIRRLDSTRPRYVVWDHGGVAYWGTERTNGPLSAYIWACYEQVADFPPYAILERRC